MVRCSRRSFLTKLANAQCKVTSGMPSPHTIHLPTIATTRAGICGAKPDHPHADMLVCMKTSSVGSASHPIAQLCMMLSPLRTTLMCTWSGLVALRRVRFPPGSPSIPRPSHIRPPLYSYHSGTKPRARFEWSGGLFLRYVRPLPTRLASRCEFGLEGDFFAFGGIVLSVLQPLVAIALSWSDSRRV